MQDIIHEGRARLSDMQPSNVYVLTSSVWLVIACLSSPSIPTISDFERAISLAAMSRIFRRLYSSTSTASASDAAAEILQRFGPDKPISVREQVLDANQLRLLTLTLGRPSLHAGGSKAVDSAPKDGTPVPPGYHLVYFLPAFLEQDLGKDGTDKTLNPLSPWTRRMWAGGELEWTQDPSRILRIGQNVKETTRVTSAQAKEMKSGGSLIIAGLEKTFENEKGVALVDRR